MHFTGIFMTEDSCQVFEVDKIKTQLSGQSVEYKEFLRVPTLSCGIYRLRTGSDDMQSLHDEDEVYYVVEGRARMMHGDNMMDVVPDTILYVKATYVKATETHSFFEIQEELTLLVFFAAAS